MDWVSIPAITVTLNSPSIPLFIQKSQQALSLVTGHVENYLIPILLLPSFVHVKNIASSSVVQILFLLLSSTAIYALARCAFSGARLQQRRQKTDKTHLHTLSKFIIPTRSTWPLPYSLLHHSTYYGESTNGKMSIPIRMLFCDIAGGNVELRNPSRDLPYFIADRLTIDRWSLSVYVKLRDIASTLLWVVREEFSLPKESLFKEPLKAADDTISTAELALLLEYSIQYIRTTAMATNKNELDTTCIASGNDAFKYFNICISPDFVPRHSTGVYIRHNQKIMNADARLLSVVSFTTCEAPVSIVDKSFTLIAYPFLYGKAMLPEVHRTSAVLFTRLHSVLAIWTSGKYALNVVSVHDASIRYAQELDNCAQKLECDEETRDAYINKAGLQPWRIKTLCMRWEAALHREGKLSRWIVILKKKDDARLSPGA